MPWHRRLLDFSGVLLLTSGVAWLGLHYLAGGSAGGLPHPLDPWAIRLHGLAAFAALFALGAVSAAHVQTGWRLSHRVRHRGQRATGIALLALAALLAASGYALYYFSPEPVRPTLGWLHAGLGIAMAAGLWLHRAGRSKGGGGPPRLKDGPKT